MKTARLQLRVPADFKKKAMDIARRRKVSLSALVAFQIAALIENDKLERRARVGEEVEQV